MTEDRPAPFSSAEIERYQRHLVMPEIGGAGQARLKAARVLLVGAGGLGAPVIAALAGAGVGEILIVDHDHVSLSNLHRQFIHSEPGVPKSESARIFAERLNPFCRITTRAERFAAETADACLDGRAIALDCTDNATTRRVLAEAAEARRVPLVSGAVNRFVGHATVFAPHLKDASGNALPRYRDLNPVDPPDDLLPVCAEVGVIGPATSLIGSIMAFEAMKVIIGMGEPLYGRLLIYEGLAARFSEMRYGRAAS